ncbi:30S ribosomal protein S19 [Candidatus Micrarchaeota archaeon CG10_big_fil_rev_8_21_14_0_10_45_29]|nr:MAG: 30S ribosomal protein S19 [Candidatus Micrarchaeota archaeon CG10_big_fil_rev_8_21_14_0_10_45_29]
MARIETYRGLTREKLEALSLEESLPLITSRGRRAVKRALEGKNTKLRQFIKKVDEMRKKTSKKPIRTHIRDAVILPFWIGLEFAVHNGKEFKPLTITIDKIGYRLGEFAHSTGRVLHSGPGIGATRGSKFIPLK